MQDDIVKIGSVELTFAECSNAVARGDMFMVVGRFIYQLMFSKNVGWHGLKLYQERGTLPLMSRGRFLLTNSTHAAKLSNGVIAA